MGVKIIILLIVITITTTIYSQIYRPFTGLHLIENRAIEIRQSIASDSKDFVSISPSLAYRPSKYLSMGLGYNFSNFISSYNFNTSFYLPLKNSNDSSFFELFTAFSYESINLRSYQNFPNVGLNFTVSGTTLNFAFGARKSFGRIHLDSYFLLSNIDYTEMLVYAASNSVFLEQVKEAIQFDNYINPQVGSKITVNSLNFEFFIAIHRSFNSTKMLRVNSLNEVGMSVKLQQIFKK